MGFQMEEIVLKKWTKNIDFDNAISIKEYQQNCSFVEVANVVLDTDTKVSGVKKRNTLIKFEPVISLEKFNEKIEWLYILTIDDFIVKIGGTRTGLKGRSASYLCGHHTTDRGKSGDCSKTNAFIYNTFLFYLNQGCRVKMYGFELPQVELITSILNKEVKIKVQTYHAYESSYILEYEKVYGGYPPLNDNCDPDYK